MPKEQLERFRFVFLSTLAFAQAATPQSALDSVFAPADDSIFRCGGLLSATEKAETLRVLGAGEFEDFVRQVDDQVSARVGCRFTLAKAYRERTDSSALLRGVLGNTGLEVVCRYTPKAYCQNLTRLYLAPLGFGFPALPSPVLSPAPPDAGP